METKLAAPHPTDEATKVLFAGLGLVLLGAVSLSLALLSSLMTVFLLGLSLVVGGMVELLEANLERRAGGGAARLLPPLLVLGVGLVLILWPVMSLRVVTPLLLALFLVDGVLLAVFALRQREGAWIAQLVTGVLNAGFGVVLASQWRSAGLELAGTLTGLYLMGRGVLFVATAARELAHLRRSAPRLREGRR